MRVATVNVFAACVVERKLRLAVAQLAPHMRKSFEYALYDARDRRLHGQGLQMVWSGESALLM